MHSECLLNQAGTPDLNPAEEQPRAEGEGEGGSRARALCVGQGSIRRDEARSGEVRRSGMVGWGQVGSGVDGRDRV